jgi:hypothetical protein
MDARVKPAHDEFCSVTAPAQRRAALRPGTENSAAAASIAGRETQRRGEKPLVYRVFRHGTAFADKFACGVVGRAGAAFVGV